MSAAPKTAFSLPGDCEVRITRLFTAPRERIFECYTQAQWLKRWLGPEGWDFAICDNDPVAGGRYRWLWRNAQGEELGMHGEYLKIVRPAEIMRTEIFEQDRNCTETIGWLVLNNTEGGTSVTTSVLFPTPEARDAALAAGMNRGIAASFDRLDLLLSLDRGGSQSAAPALVL
jgi:uncharacterized protein YndB with AHSA1/START domain